MDGPVSLPDPQSAVTDHTNATVYKQRGEGPPRATGEPTPTLAGSARLSPRREFSWIFSNTFNF